MTAVMKDYRTLEVEIPAPKIGAIVSGIDLRDDLSAACREELRDLLAEREVLFLYDQDIAPADHLRFARIFGEPRKVSFFFPSLEDSEHIQVLESHGGPTGTDVWHTDHSWQTRPPVATCLHSQILPPSGGDTLWTSMTSAYDSLSSGMKDLIEDLTAVHTWEKSIAGYVRQGEGGEDRYLKQREAFPPVVHKVVQTHPVTGKRLLFVNGNFTTTIEGLPRQEGDALLSFLVSTASVPEHQVRLRWRPKTVVIWDNRSTQHYAVADYQGHRRLHRITLEDDALGFSAVTG